MKRLGIEFWILRDGGFSSLCPACILRSDSNNNTLDSAQSIQLFEGNMLWFLLSNCLAENKTFLVIKLSRVPIQTFSNSYFLTKNWGVGFLFCFVLSLKQKNNQKNPAALLFFCDMYPKRRYMGFGLCFFFLRWNDGDGNSTLYLFYCRV